MSSFCFKISRNVKHLSDSNGTRIHNHLVLKRAPSGTDISIILKILKKYFENANITHWQAYLGPFQTFLMGHFWVWKLLTISQKKLHYRCFTGLHICKGHSKSTSLKNDILKPPPQYHISSRFCPFPLSLAIHKKWKTVENDCDNFLYIWLLIQTLSPKEAENIRSHNMLTFIK